MPDELAALLALPGIGPYTARAVLVFAFERDEAIVDTNVARLYARWTRTAPDGRARCKQLADAAGSRRGRDGRGTRACSISARPCAPSARRACDECPARAWCAWRRRGCAEPDPAVGSAGVSGRQSRFEGSDRQGRGRLVDALRRNDGLTEGRLARTRRLARRSATGAARGRDARGGWLWRSARRWADGPPD